MAPPLRLALKVIPGSSREGLAGWLGDSLKVRVRVPAERGGHDSPGAYARRTC